jgi:hypothetical protein
MSLSTKELDLVEFLVAQVASLSSSLAVEVAGEAVVTESSDLPPMACEVVSLQPIPVVLLAPSYDRGYIDRWVVPPPPTVALELQAAGVGESFKAKPPDIAVLVAYPKGLAAKCRGRTVKLTVPCHRLSSSSRCRMARPRSCSLHHLLGVAPSGHRYSTAAPSVCSRVSVGLLQSALGCGCSSWSRRMLRVVSLGPVV